ncbi:hypothetical protein C3L33_02627, partial [Rhododendron williamsianum]
MRNLIFQKPEVSVAVDVTGSLSYGWQHIRIPVIVPLLSIAIHLCVGMSIMLFVERVYMAIVIICVKLLGKKRYTKYKLDDLKEDLERNKSYPLVLIQIPMYNEKEKKEAKPLLPPNTAVDHSGAAIKNKVYKLSIGSACALSWPSDRLIVQVLDDSTNKVLRALVELECQKWVEKGVNVKYETRNNRNGYKAGALRDGLQKQYVQECEFVAIFDADFQPDKDFLWRAIPYLLENPELGLVQARWKFVNADECLMTRLQEMSLDYHFSVEQEVGSSMYSFFGFNGTAGVWRIQAVNDAGGWKDRTTVEDMDLAVRASLKGMLCKETKAIPLLSYYAEGVNLEEISLSVLVPEVHLPKPIAIYLPATITILNAVCTPRSMHLLVFWILFENVMSLHRSKAAVIGLLEANRVNEWVVTEKLGNTSKQKCNAKISKKPQSRIGERIHVLELIMGMFMLHCAIYNLLFGKDHFFVYLLLQAGAFFIIGFGHVGTFVPN